VPQPLNDRDDDALQPPLAGAPPHRGGVAPRIDAGA
jgi:hypothetical protein